MDELRPRLVHISNSNDVQLSGVRLINSPFWTVNPAFCDNVTIHGVTINNPSSNPKGPNTDGINPSSCRNVRISDCFISVGDDCITIKSGRDADGRKYGKHAKTSQSPIVSCFPVTVEWSSAAKCRAV